MIVIFFNVNFFFEFILNNFLVFQFWMLSKDGEIRRDESCIDYAGKDVMIFPCHGNKGNQEWKYNQNVCFKFYQYRSIQ